MMESKCTLCSRPLTFPTIKGFKGYSNRRSKERQLPEASTKIGDRAVSTARHIIAGCSSTGPLADLEAAAYDGKHMTRQGKGFELTVCFSFLLARGTKNSMAETLSSAIAAWAESFPLEGRKAVVGILITGMGPFSLSIHSSSA